jgi:hypothetical protein
MTLVARIDEQRIAWLDALCERVEALKPFPIPITLSPVQPTEEEARDGQFRFLTHEADCLRRTVQSYKRDLICATGGVVLGIVFALMLVGLLTDISWHTIVVVMCLMAGSASASLAVFLFYHHREV